VSTLDNKTSAESNSFRILPSKLFDNVNKYKGSINLKNTQKKLIDKMSFGTKVYKLRPDAAAHSAKKYYGPKGYGKTDVYGNETPPTFGVWAGYYCFKVGSETLLYFYRTELGFNVKQLKGKGKIVRASLHYRRYKNKCSGMGGTRPCGFKVYNVIKSESDIFHSKISSQPIRIDNFASLVEEWIKSGKNYPRLLFMGESENRYMRGDKTCMTYLDNVYIRVEVEPNK